MDSIKEHLKTMLEMWEERKAFGIPLKYLLDDLEDSAKVLVFLIKEEREKL